MRSLNLDQLRTLTEVAQLSSFSAAARRLNLTQPAVSLQIRELEDRLGVRLIDRVGKRAVASDAGTALLAHAAEIFQATERALAAMQQHRIGTIGRVHIGAGATAVTYILPPILQQLREAYPDLELMLTSGTTRAICDSLLDNEVDLGLVTLPVDEKEFAIHPLRLGGAVAIFPANAKNVPDVVRPADVAQRPLVLDQERGAYGRLARQWLDAAGVDARPAIELDNIEAIKNIVAAGLGMSIVPGAAIRERDHHLITRPLDPPLQATFALIQRRTRPDNTALKVVREAVLAGTAA